MVCAADVFEGWWNARWTGMEDTSLEERLEIIGNDHITFDSLGQPLCEWADQTGVPAVICTILRDPLVFWSQAPDGTLWAAGLFGHPRIALDVKLFPLLGETGAIEGCEMTIQPSVDMTSE